MATSDNAAMSGALKFVLIVVGVIVFVAAPFFFFGDQIDQFFAGDGAIVWLREFGNLAWFVAIGLLIADLAFPIPTTAIMAALGMIYGPVLGGVYASLGSVISGLVGYGLCRFLGRPIALWLNGEQGLSRGEQLFSGVGGWIVAMSRWLPILSEVVACAAGLSRMRFSVFVLALICGSIPMGFAYAIIGYMGGGRPVLTLAISAVFPFLLWFLVRPILRRNAG